MREPIVHVGLHKTATKWWQSVYFDAHPGSTVITEYRHEWDDPLVRTLVGVTDRTFSVAEARRRYAEQSAGVAPDRVPVVTSERLSGHPFSNGCDALPIAERLAATLPAARVLIGIREQGAMVVSLYWQMVREGYPGRLEDFIGARRWKASAFTLDYLHYDVLVERYQRLYGVERVAVVPIERLASDPEGTVADTARTLGLDPDVLPPTTRVNTARPQGQDRAQRLANRFRRTDPHPFPLVYVPDRVLRPILPGLGRLLARRPDEGLPAEEVHRIREQAAPSNARLRALTGLDLEGYS